MKNYLTSLNGWQRIYAVLFVFLYFPVLITIAVGVYVDPTKSIVIEENLKIELTKRKINIEIKVLKDADYSNTTTKLSTAQELATKEKINEIIEIQGSNYYWKYFLQINKEVEEKIQQEISSILYNEIENEFRKKYFQEIIKIVGLGMVIAFFIYAFGYAIGWVIKGFKHSKES